MEEEEEVTEGFFGAVAFGAGLFAVAFTFADEDDVLEGPPPPPPPPRPPLAVDADCCVPEGFADVS